MCTKKSMPKIKYAFASIKKQNYKNFELIVCHDDTDNDGTREFLKKNKKLIKNLINYRNKGIYKSLNKAIKYCRGDIIGVLHSDDEFYNNSVLNKINNFFKNNNIEISYSNINYTKKNNRKKILRKWRENIFNKKNIEYGWMPPHTSMFIKSEVLKRNLYNPKYKIAADYDLILRLINKNYSFKFLDIITTNMSMGGVSNSSLKNIMNKMIEDFNIIKSNKLEHPLKVLFFKNILKLKQFF